MVAISYDAAFERMQDLARDMDAHASDRNEAATRLQIVDRLLFECLGWDRATTQVEDHEGGQFADYVLDAQRRSLVVEAKREGRWFEIPNGTARVASLAALYGLGGEISAALEQAEGYAQRRGAPYAAICNGHQVVAFIASRQDGISPRDGRALVFDSPADMVEDFAALWAALGPIGASTRDLTRRLASTETPPPPKLSEQLPDYPGATLLNEKLLLLSTVEVLFLPNYVRDDSQEDEFLRECYSPPGAYSQLSALNRGILRTRYSTALGESLNVALDEARTKDGLNPELVAEVATTAAGREPLILLGNVGVGKTMFIRRLLRVDAKELANDAVMLYIDLGHSAVLEDPAPYVSSEIRLQLLERHEIDIDAGDFVRGTYHREIRQFARGIDAALLETDQAEFRRREIAYLHELTGHVERHLQRSLEHLVKLRRKQIIVVLDNTDQRDAEAQDEVFLISQTIAHNWPCTVFVTLRPETFHHSRVSGALAGYQPRAYTIQPPRVERVVTKRLEYGLSHYQANKSLPAWLGWTASSDDLELYLKILLKSFTRSDALQAALINLAGTSARRGLELVRGFVQSPHSDAALTLDRNRDPDRSDYLVPHHVFLKSVLLGANSYYSPATSQIPNAFDISTSDPREHFLLPCVLGRLHRAADDHTSEGYVAAAEIYTYFQDLGFDATQIDFAVQRGLSGDLLEGIPPDEAPGALRITTVGAYFRGGLIREFAYLDEVLVDTPIVDPSVRQTIEIVKSTRRRLARAETVLGYLDASWSASGLEETGLFDWTGSAVALRKQLTYIADRL